MVGYLAETKILTNNLYGGAIFSCLTVSEIPSVPKTLAELADSGLWIATWSYFVPTKLNSDGHHDIKSELRDRIIPELIQNTKDSILTSTIHKIKEKILFPPDKNFMNIHGHKVTNKETMARMDNAFQLKYLLQAQEVLEDSLLVISNKEEMPFRVVYLWSGEPNYFSLKTSLCMTQLFEAGIYFRWKTLEIFKSILVELSTENRAKFFMKTVKNSVILNVVFNEKEPVSFLVMQYVLVLCGVAVMVGLLAFAVECKAALGCWGIKILRKGKSLIENSLTVCVKRWRYWRRKASYFICKIFSFPKPSLEVINVKTRITEDG